MSNQPSSIEGLHNSFESDESDTDASSSDSETSSSESELQDDMLQEEPSHTVTGSLLGYYALQFSKDLD